MGVFKYRNPATGNWEKIVSIKGIEGEVGEDGEQGVSGIYVGSEKPIRDDVHIWINDSPEEASFPGTFQTRWGYDEPGDTFGNEGDLYIQLNNDAEYCYNYSNGVLSLKDDFKTALNNNESFKVDGKLIWEFGTPLPAFDTDLTTSLTSTFKDMTVTELDLSEWETSKINTINSMCYGCSDLVTINLNNWVTSGILYAPSCFRDCISLKNIIGIENFTCENNTLLSYSFRNCSSLTSLNLSSMITTKITSMVYIFCGCTLLEEIIGLENFTCENNTSLSNGFRECISLTSVNLSSMITKNLSSLENTFYYCTSLTEIIGIENWTCENNTNLANTFRDCSSLTSINLSSMVTTAATNMFQTFRNCTMLKEIIGIENFTCENNTSLYGAFRDCSSLTSLNLSSMITTKITSMAYAFYGCILLEEIMGIENFTCENNTSLQATFAYCSNLINLDLSNMITKNVTTIAYMCDRDYKLETINVLGWDTSKVTLTNSAFGALSAIKILDLSSFDMSSVTYSDWMFSESYALTTIYGRTQEDCDILKATAGRPSYVSVVVKSTYSAALSVLSIQPASTEEEQIEQLTEMGVDYATLEEV